MMSSNAASADPLAPFIRAAKERHVPDDALVALLRHNGWPERRVYRELSAYYGGDLGLTPPARSSGSEYANQAFLYLLNFITLGFWVAALGQIFCAVIARGVADPANPVATHSLVFDVSWQLATLIVAFPCFLVVARLIGRDLAQRPDAAHSGVRLWLTYIALVVAGVITLCDGIWFVAEFLRGELTLRFVLNTVVVVGLGGSVFAYYLSALRPAADPDR
jgi:hypothetical protein